MAIEQWDPLEVYDRQSRIATGGVTWDQHGIENARVLLVGGGNIGGGAATQLARTGFVHIDIVDIDIVSIANLSRGVFLPADVGRAKAEALADILRAINPRAIVRSIVGDVRWDFGTGLFRRYDLILLATHDLASRMHINRFAHRFGGVKAIIDGAIDELSFSVQTILPGESPCYACALPLDTTDPDSYAGCNGVVTNNEAPPAATNGMDGMATAALMAKEAAMIAAGLGPMLAAKELRLDGGSQSVAIYRRAWRTSCSDHVPAPREAMMFLDIETDTRLVDIRAQVASALGVELEAVRLFSSYLITRSLTCQCGEVIRVMRPQKASLKPACNACGNADPSAFVTDRTFELVDDDIADTVGDYGIPDGQVLEAYIADARYFIVPGKE